MRYLLVTILFIVLLAGSFWAGSWYKQRETAKVKSSGLKSAGVNTGTVTDTATDTEIDTSSLPPGSISITPEKQQVIGVRTAIVEKTALNHTIRTVGRVAADETRTYRLIASVDGWIRETYDNATGTLVKKGERMASFYSPQFYAAMQAYISAAISLRHALADPAGRIGLQQYIDSLESLGMSQPQIDELVQTRQYTEKIFIIAPATSFILARNVSAGQRFEKGTEWYRLADLSRVWILTDTYEDEAQYLKPGIPVKVFLSALKKTFIAKVSNALPLFDLNTRTLKVRLEADNPGYFLRPDMFVDVEVPIQLPPALTVLADAILDSGIKKTVFVDLGNGFFEPREVEIGWRLGNRVEITKGLKPGERIVVSGNFMIDSESRLEMAAAGMYGTMSKDPVCGVDVSINKAVKSGRKSTYQGRLTISLPMSARSNSTKIRIGTLSGNRRL